MSTFRTLLIAAALLFAPWSHAQSPGYRVAHRYRVDVKSSGTELGAHEARQYDAADLLRVGCWHLHGGNDDAGAVAGMVRAIDPVAYALYFSQQMPPAAWVNKYKSASEPYNWAPNSPTYTLNDETHPRLEYNLQAYSEPPYELWRIRWPNWPMWISANVPVIVEWLDPGRLKGTKFGAPYPYMHFHSPHHGIKNVWLDGDMQFYASNDCYEWGLDWMVDGFYEQMRYLHALGVTCAIQIGRPGKSNQYALRGQRQYDDVVRRCRYGRVQVALDAAVGGLVDGIDGQTAQLFHDAGDGVGIEGVFPLNSAPEVMAWLETPYQMNVYGPDFFDRVHPDYQKGWAEANFTTLDDPDFDDDYGYRWWLIQLPLNWYRDDPITGFDFANDATADAYLAAYAAKVRELLAMHPRVIALLPFGLPQLAAARRFRVENFLPE